jgi:PAS domain S-box-containing protein
MLIEDGAQLSNIGRMPTPPDGIGGKMGTLIRARDWSTARLGAADEWPASLQTLVGLMLNSRQPMFIAWGPERSLLYNDSYAPILGRRHPDALGRPFFDVWPEVVVEVGGLMDQVYAGTPVHMDNLRLMLERNGFTEEAYFSFSYTPIRVDGGRIDGLFCACTETTRQVLSGRDSAKAVDMQRGLLQRMPGFIAAFSGPEHTFEYVNDAYISIGGPRQFVGRTFRQVFPELAGQGYYELLDEAYQTGTPVSAHAMPVRLSGETQDRYVDFVFQPVRDADGHITGVFLGGYETTDIVRTTQSLRDLNANLEREVTERSRERSRTWQVSSDMLGVASANGYFERTNPAWQTILGWSEAEIAATPVLDFVHPDDVDATGAALGQLGNGIPVLRFENRYRTKTGNYRWLSWVAVPEGHRYYCSARDITHDKRQAEALAAAEAQLRQSQKMEAVGQLTGGLAHDFNNLLTGISGSLEFIRSRLAQGRIQDIERYVDAAQGASRRAASLTHRLLAFSRRQTLDPKPTDMDRLVAGMADLIRRTVGPAIEVEHVISGEAAWPALVDQSQVENALLNLCINARDAMPEGGAIRIETDNCWLDAVDARERDLPSGQYVNLRVSDNGCGMTPEVIAKAFEPFFTTKPIGVGTGLGLSMVYGFARQSGGHVDISSRVGRGSVVTLHLPRYAGVVAEAEQAPLSHDLAAASHSGRVLVVDDEPTVLMLLSETLGELGYQVLEAHDGASSLAVLRSGEHIDLLVTDVGLPGGMNGRQVADAARTMRPDLKVLFVTGYAENVVLSGDVLDLRTRVLTKPFAMTVLADRVRELIALP